MAGDKEIEIAKKLFLGWSSGDGRGEASGGQQGERKLDGAQGENPLRSEGATIQLSRRSGKTVLDGPTNVTKLVG